MSFHAVSSGPNKKRLHYNINEDGNLIAHLKEPGLHVEPFLEVDRAEAIDFMKGMVEASADFGIKIPEEITGSNRMQLLEEDIRWLRSVVDKLIEK